MAKRIGKYKVSKREAALSAVDGATIEGSLTGITNLTTSGTNTFSGATTLTSAAQFNGGYAGAKTVIALDATTYAPSVAESGAILVFDGTACTVTLPTCAAGLQYTFIVAATGAVDSIVTTAGSDKLYGLCILSRAVGTLNVSSISNVTTALDPLAGDDTLTMNGSTKGGVIGSRIEVIGVAANVWSVQGHIMTSGNMVTCAS